MGKPYEWSKDGPVDWQDEPLQTLAAAATDALPHPKATSFVHPKQEWKVDRHRPTLMLSGKRKGKPWELYVGSREKVADHAWEYDLIVNCTGDPLAPHKNNIIPSGLGISAKRWKNPLAAREIVLAWQDFGTPGLPLEFWKELLAAITRKRRTLLFCQSGHGRTGTALSILTMLAKRIPGKAAVEKVRKEYCPKAVETQAQKEYVVRLGELAGLGKGKK